MKVLRLALVGCLLLGLAAVSHGEAKNKADKGSVKDKIVGVWEPLKGDLPSGSTVEFTKDGKLIITVKAENQAVTVDGTYEVNGDTVQTKLKEGDKERTEMLTVTTVTDTDLVTKDSSGK